MINQKGFLIAFTAKDVSSPSSNNKIFYQKYVDCGYNKFSSSDHLLCLNSSLECGEGWIGDNSRWYCKKCANSFPNIDHSLCITEAKDCGKGSIFFDSKKQCIACAQGLIFQKIIWNV